MQTRLARFAMVEIAKEKGTCEKILAEAKNEARVDCANSYLDTCTRHIKVGVGAQQTNHGRQENKETQDDFNHEII